MVVFLAAVAQQGFFLQKFAIWHVVMMLMNLLGCYDFSKIKDFAYSLKTLEYMLEIFCFLLKIALKKPFLMSPLIYRIYG